STAGSMLKERSTEPISMRRENWSRIVLSIAACSGPGSARRTCGAPRWAPSAASTRPSSRGAVLRHCGATEPGAAPRPSHTPARATTRMPARRPTQAPTTPPLPDPTSCGTRSGLCGAARYGGNDSDLVRRLQRRVQALPQPDVLIVQEKVDELPRLAVV